MMFSTIAVLTVILIASHHGSHSTDVISNSFDIQQNIRQLEFNVRNISEQLHKTNNPDLLTWITKFPQNFGVIAKYNAWDGKIFQDAADYLGTIESIPIPGLEQNFIKNVRNIALDMSIIMTDHYEELVYVSKCDPYHVIQYQNGNFGYPQTWISGLINNIWKMTVTFHAFSKTFHQLIHTIDTPSFHKFSQDKQFDIQHIINWSNDIANIIEDIAEVIEQQVYALKSLDTIEDKQSSGQVYLFYDPQRFLTEFSVLCNDVGDLFELAGDVCNEFATHLDGIQIRKL